MADSATPTPDHERVFDRIWTQLPDRQNRSSSSWWFFILFPDGDSGYGPRQLMFSVAARVGDRIRVNDEWLPGIDLDRKVEDGVDEFDVISVGWDGDDESVDDHVVKQPARATLSHDGSLVAWHDTEDGDRRGSEIRTSEDHPLGLHAHFVGEKGEAEFEAWGDLDSEMTAPVESMKVDDNAAGVDVVAYRQMRFEGEFDLPRGRETLTGSCYFQRVCFNVPLFPWKWIWALFPDGTAFSAMIPFVGPHVTRKGYGFFDSEPLERATIPIQPSAMWAAPGADPVSFDDVSIEPVLDSPGDHPDFAVDARTDDGEHLEFIASTYGHARNYIDRPLLGDRVESHWSYNEFLFEMTDLDGRVDGQHVSTETMGDCYGTLEYSTGFGL